MKTILLLLMLIPIPMFSQMKVKDESRVNQLKSMEFMQWEFSPDWYYYSWVTKKIKIFGTTVGTYQVPGAGVHDRGPGGIGLGDGYVRTRKNNVQQYIPMGAFVEDKKNKTKEEGEKAEIIYKQERAKFIDKSVDAQYFFYSSSFKNLQSDINNEITTYANNGGISKNINTLKNELERIEKNIEVINKSHLASAKKREAYIGYENELKELLGYIKNLNRIQKLNKI